MTTRVVSHRPAVQVPDLALPDHLLRAADDRPDAPAVIDGPSGRTLTYGELRRDVRRCAVGLRRRGMRPGDVLAIVAPNSPEWLVACLGAMAAGGVVSGINPLYTADEIAPQLRDHGARFLLTIPPFLPLVQAAAAGIDDLDLLVLGEAEGATPFADVLADGDLPGGLVDPATDLALLPYSSGTTGLAKGVMLTHRAMVTNVEQMQASMALTPDDRSIAAAPFFHAVGLVVVAGVTLRAGGAVVTLPRFEVDAYLGAIAEHRVTVSIVVPPIILAMARHPAVARHDLSSLRLLGCGAAPLGAELQQECAERVGCPVGQGYGMTEAVAAIALFDPTRPVVPGSVGVLLPGVEARIVDVMSGADLGVGETGELVVRGPQLMAGYLNNPEATAATIDTDGWLHTGDLARFDADGNLFVDDRLKELVKVKGLQVAPAELEALLRTHPAVADAAVIPVPDERAGERPKAVVVATGAVDAEELLAFVAARVAPHKRITEVAFVDAIPVSPSGKILRRLLVAQDRAGALSAAPARAVAAP
ncbi:acyl-CoA synthetase (AMP-forming)/AMP-acid ligase II [Actinomycetospora succinea]|uniref:Acyl-CoA synthetase (AMP-forming)/AMP-acid ligase II n=1 Tax=Actinomycetospora succinea TaxID=663603 RepID=A0A4R6VIL9_9PSEU|nr:AMP-binding protein [Actinomycetospora succinea]TDQ62656.1 acyl-CoA synthetase (AMP-forming)/AMP-acid ligase II [Actinomycetospora succinea]